MYENRKRCEVEMIGVIEGDGGGGLAGWLARPSGRWRRGKRHKIGKKRNKKKFPIHYCSSKEIDRLVIFVDLPHFDMKTKRMWGRERMLNWPRTANSVSMYMRVCVLNGTSLDCSLIIRDFKSNGRMSVCEWCLIQRCWWFPCDISPRASSQLLLHTLIHMHIQSRVKGDGKLKKHL